MQNFVVRVGFSLRSPVVLVMIIINEGGQIGSRGRITKVICVFR